MKRPRKIWLPIKKIKVKPYALQGDTVKEQRIVQLGKARSLPKIKIESSKTIEGRRLAERFKKINPKLNSKEISRLVSAYLKHQQRVRLNKK